MNSVPEDPLRERLERTHENFAGGARQGESGGGARAGSGSVARGGVRAADGPEGGERSHSRLRCGTGEQREALRRSGRRPARGSVRRPRSRQPAPVMTAPRRTRRSTGRPTAITKLTDKIGRAHV